MTLRGVLLLALVAAAAVAFMPLQANATTEAAKLTAINNGLAWLATQQNLDGSWNASGYGPADTGAALLAFQEHGYHTGDSSIYDATVTKGLDYLMSTASMPGANMVGWRNSGEDSYVTGLVLPAIATSGAGSKLVTAAVNPVLAGLNMTYQQVAQATVNYFAWGQRADGGWGYAAAPEDDPIWGRSDGSTSQWPVIGMMFASTRMGAVIPASVNAGVANWINIIQNPGNGGSDYTPGDGWTTMSKTGGLLVEQKFLGLGTADPRVAAAIRYLNANWTMGTPGGDVFQGNFGHPYAMWSVYKGLETMTGLHSNAIANLHAAQGMDPGDTWNWWEDYCDYLVGTQNLNGSWNGYPAWTNPYWPNTLATAWDINILLATQVGPVIPEPVTMIGVLAGIGGLVGYVRRRRLA